VTPTKVREAKPNAGYLDPSLQASCRIRYSGKVRGNEMPMIKSLASCINFNNYIEETIKLYWHDVFSHILRYRLLAMKLSLAKARVHSIV